MSSLPIPQLQAFLAVARLKNFSSAARELGVSRSAVSQSVRLLEAHLRLTLLTRTTRSVGLTDAGQRLVERTSSAVAQLCDALTESSEPGEAVGTLRLSVPRVAVPFVIDPLLVEFRRRHPRVQVELDVEDRLVDIVAKGYDAGIRLIESIERDMVQVRLTQAFRFVVVGAPSYLKRRGAPERPEDLLHHECLTFRTPTTGALYAWEFERGRRTWRVAVRGGIVTTDGTINGALAERGLGLAYVLDSMVEDALREGRLRVVLDAYSATVPGFFLYFPNRSQQSEPLRLFVDVAKQVMSRRRSSLRSPSRD
ncbi:MAG TPA: LysR family transcriptional regulator [Labilithrix sp.]|nr:LysR family transcriptional regulator [Labilithrix sp.]